MGLKNRNRPNSGFTAAALRLAHSHAECEQMYDNNGKRRLTPYTAPVKAVKRTAPKDITGAALVDKAAMLGKAIKAQGKHIKGGCTIVYDAEGVMVLGFHGLMVWRDLTTGQFCPSPVV